MLGSYEGAMVDRAVEAATAQTPAERPTPGERLIASVETSVAAYQRGRREGLQGFATHLRNLAKRGVNERVTESMLAIADIADREAEGRL